MNLKIKTMPQSIPRLFMFSMIKSKILLPLVAILQVFQAMSMLLVHVPMFKSAL